MQRLTVGARLAIKMHSKTGNVTQLRHDLRNGLNPVFSDHSQCNHAFCKVTTKENDDNLTEISLVFLRGNAMQQDYEYRSVQFGNCKHWSTLRESHLARDWSSSEEEGKTTGEG